MSDEIIIEVTSSELIIVETGPRGPAGPNQVTTTTATDLTGIFYGNGSTVSAIANGAVGYALKIVSGVPAYAPDISGAVDSVNGQTGVVVLTYSDVGADQSGAAAAVASDLADHLADLANPHAVTAAQVGADPVGAAAAAQAYAIQRANHTGTQTLSTISDAGTAAAYNVPASGDAASGEVMLGSDSRNTNARTPTAHAASHVNGTDDIQLATNAQKGLASAAHITAIEANTAHAASTANPHSTTLQQGYDSGTGIVTLSSAKPVKITAPDSSSGTVIVDLANNTSYSALKLYSDGNLHLNSTGSFRSGAYIGFGDGGDYFGDGGDTSPYVGIGELLDDALSLWATDIRFSNTKTGSVVVEYYPSAGIYQFRSSSGSTKIHMDCGNDRIGLGTTSPAVLLHLYRAAYGKLGGIQISGSGQNGNLFISDGTEGVGVAGDFVWTKNNQISTGGNLRLFGSGNMGVVKKFSIGSAVEPTFESSAYNAWGATDKGWLLPVLTTAQRTAIASPAEGLEVHDSDLKATAKYENGEWHFLGLRKHTPHTAGGSVSLGEDSNAYNPPTLQASPVLTLPSSPPDKTRVSVTFGGIIAIGSTVATGVTFAAAQTMFFDNSAKAPKGGDSYTFEYVKTLTRWEQR